MAAISAVFKDLKELGTIILSCGDQLLSQVQFFAIPWTFPRKNTGVSCHFLLQRIFPGQGSSMYLLHWQVDSLPLFSSVQRLSCVPLFATPWTTACQTSLSITNSQTLLKFMSIELVMPSNHLILWHPLLLQNHSQHQCLFQWVSSSHQVDNWSFSFSISPSNEYSGLISFRMDWLDLLAVQGTLKSLLQHHS